MALNISIDSLIETPLQVARETWRKKANSKVSVGLRPDATGNSSDFPLNVFYINKSSELQALGIEILGLSFLAIKPTLETARALEAEAREQILREADEAVYSRRNSAVEQERRIKKNEFNTEIAIESKKRQIRETQIEAERSIQQKQHELQQSDMEAKIAMEARNTELVTLAMDNAKREADVKSYAVAGLMQAYSSTDPKLIQALAMSGMQPGQMIALAFQELADKAGKIGQLNITPDLLREVINTPARS